AIARDPGVARHFPDGIFWVSQGERGDALGAQIDLLGRLGVNDAEVRSLTHGTAVLRSTLQDRRVLLVVDDVWSDAAALAFDVVGRGGRVLYTSRDKRVLEAAGARIQQVDVLAEGSARELLAAIAQINTGALPAEADAVV